MSSLSLTSRVDCMGLNGLRLLHGIVVDGPACGLLQNL